MTDEVNNNSEDKKEEKGDLVLSQKHKTNFGVGGVGSLALVGLVLIVVLTVLIVRSQSSKEDILSFAPADSIYALEVENIEGAADVMDSLSIWKDDRLTKGALITEFSHWFGADGDIIKKFAGNVKSVTLLESLVANKPEKLLILKVGNGWDIESYYKREYSKISTPVTFAPSMHGLKITRDDKSAFYLKKVANFVLLSDEKSLLLRALSAYKGKELSLAACNIKFGDGESEMPRVRFYTAINSMLVNNPEYKLHIPQSVQPDIAGDAAFLYEATLNAGGFVAEGKFIRNEAAGYASGNGASSASRGGIISSIFWTILIIIIVLIAIPIVFVAFTLLLALYFFIAAWLKGELVPIDPPLKDLSDNLKEDIGVKAEAAEKQEVPEKEQAEPGAAENTDSTESKE